MGNDVLLNKRLVLFNSFRVYLKMDKYGDTGV